MTLGGTELCNLATGWSASDIHYPDDGAIAWFDISIVEIAIFPPGEYHVQITGYYEGYETESSVSHTFKVTLVDPDPQDNSDCTGTSFVNFVINNSAMLSGGFLQIPMSAPDTLSQTNGNSDGFTYCGAREYIVSAATNPNDVKSQAVITDNMLELYFTVVATVNIIIDVKLVDFPDV